MPGKDDAAADGQMQEQCDQRHAIQYLGKLFGRNAAPGIHDACREA